MLDCKFFFWKEDAARLIECNALRIVVFLIKLQAESVSFAGRPCHEESGFIVKDATTWQRI